MVSTAQFSSSVSFALSSSVSLNSSNHGFSFPSFPSLPGSVPFLVSCWVCSTKFSFSNSLLKLWNMLTSLPSCSLLCFHRLDFIFCFPSNLFLSSILLEYSGLVSFFSFLPPVLLPSSFLVLRPFLLWVSDIFSCLSLSSLFSSSSFLPLSSHLVLFSSKMLLHSLYSSHSFSFLLFSSILASLSALFCASLVFHSFHLVYASSLLSSTWLVFSSSCWLVFVVILVIFLPDISSSLACSSSQFSSFFLHTCSFLFTSFQSASSFLILLPSNWNLVLGSLLA